eukprot:CAMPEP_0114555274 /NCGR_PEP_ID=MMETSP0114-20121206/8662_1 /TAXON_ID=31324 /ORGANISM="Goniomonas sp, Strain m" /LENGTH=432 /DNA_ID=CAMNT_0001740389 /DNA_START=20 /DNA_END=1318 /DNA_ORIENTATION=-
MHTVRFSWAVLALAAFVAAVPAGELEVKEGSVEFCQAGKAIHIDYRTRGVGGEKIINIDKLDGLHSVECDLDHTQLKVKFHNDLYAAKYLVEFTVMSTFLTGGEKHGCPIKADPTHNFLMRRVVGVSEDGRSLKIHTAPARYDDIYESADILFNAVRGDSCSESKHVCVGVNTDDTCENAAGPIPVFANEFLTLTCSDCFIAFEADVFFAIKIKDWKLQTLEAGFRNATVNGDLTLDLLATTSWSTGVDKTLSIVPHADLISFNIGPVPFVIWFEAPLEIKANAMFHATAEAIAGVRMNWTIGDYTIKWDPTNHWEHIKPTPKLHFLPSVSGSASFDATADFAVIPSVGMHVDNLFKYAITIAPQVNMEVQGSTETQQICETATYNVDLSSEAEMQININSLNIHIDKVYGPKLIWSSGTQNISHACVPAKL